MTTNQPTPLPQPPVVSGPVIPTQAAAPEAQPQYPYQPVPQVIVNNAAPVVTGRPKSGWATFWLDAFFGFLGVHRFYLGHIGMGLLYLFTGGLFMVGAIVDLFIAWKITRKENVRRGFGPVTR